MDIEELQKKVIEFRDAWDWGQYHNPKDLALSFPLEAAELLEIFQWKDPGEVERPLDHHPHPVQAFYLFFR